MCPPEGTLGYVTCALAANSTKRRKKMGSSVAHKTIGTFLSQNKRHEDACGWPHRCKAVGLQRYASGRRCVPPPPPQEMLSCSAKLCPPPPCPARPRHTLVCPALAMVPQTSRGLERRPADLAHEVIHRLLGLVALGLRAATEPLADAPLHRPLGHQGQLRHQRHVARHLQPCGRAQACGCGGAPVCGAGVPAEGAHEMHMRQQRSESGVPSAPLSMLRGGGGWHKALVSDCLPLAAPIGPSPLLILTLCGPERVLVVSTEPPHDLSCLTTPGVGRPGDGAVARAVDQGHPDAPSESMRGFANSSSAGGGGLAPLPKIFSTRKSTSLEGVHHQNPRQLNAFRAPASDAPGAPYERAPGGVLGGGVPLLDTIRTFRPVHPCIQPPVQGMRRFPCDGLPWFSSQRLSGGDS